MPWVHLFWLEYLKKKRSTAQTGNSTSKEHVQTRWKSIYTVYGLKHSPLLLYELRPAYLLSHWPQSWPGPLPHWTKTCQIYNPRLTLAWFFDSVGMTQVDAVSRKREPLWTSAALSTREGRRILKSARSVFWSVVVSILAARSLGGSLIHTYALAQMCRMF